MSKLKDNFKASYPINNHWIAIFNIRPYYVMKKIL